MTPKEKAKELVEKYLRIEDDTTFYWEAYNDTRYLDDEVLPHAKKCALIVVDEIISACKYNNIELYSTDWWKKVKQEIEKL
jgi:hypothetical protein